MCVLGKEHYYKKPTMPKKLTYVEKCQYEPLKQKIVECLINLFS